MERGAHGERYLVGAANWTFDKFFGRLERLTKVAAPRFSLPAKLTVPGARALHTLYRQWKLAPPIEPEEVEMAEYFWYLDAAKATRELNFAPRDCGGHFAGHVNYVRENFLGKGAFV
jgi:dihydroflavonol-4-reductase